MSIFSFTKPPLTIESTLCWLDVSVQSSIIESLGKISQWSDLSGRGNHFTQSSGSLQPQLVGNSIYFDETTYFDCLTSLSGLLSSNNSHTIFIVFKAIDPTSSTGTDFLFFNTNVSGADDGFAIGYLSDVLRHPVVKSSVFYDKSNRLFGNTNIMVCNVTWDTSLLDNNIYLNMINNPTTGTSTLAVTGSTLTRLGSRNSTTSRFFGYMYEVIISNKLYTTEERNYISRYLGNKWATPTI